MGRIPAGSLLLFAPIAIAVALLVQPASAQPFDAWATSDGHPTPGFVEIAHHPSLNPTTGFTFEAWVLIVEPAFTCDSIAGKAFKETWWVGFCEHVSGDIVLRSYLRGTGSLFDAGVLPTGQWTHIAITWDSAGATRRHYINGEQVGSVATVGPLPTNTRALRLLSDVDWQVSPHGALDEVRLWNVRRTQEQIRANLNVRVATAQPGLVAVWPLDGHPNDIIGARDGVAMGPGIHALTSAVAANCGSQTATSLCLNDRFRVTARYRVGGNENADHEAMTIPCGGAICEGSGIFWFFQDTNWELMVKSLNGCGLGGHRWWLFTAGLTNVFFRLEVTDVTHGETKIYFNYPGPPAPAITDTSAFATCP